MHTAIIQFGYNDTTSRSGAEEKSSLEDGEYRKAFSVFEDMAGNDLDLGPNQYMSCKSNSTMIVDTHAIQTIVSSINERVDYEIYYYEYWL